MEFKMFYKKNKNEKLFKSLEDPKYLDISQTQNYIPIYDTFFSLNTNNFNNINLNNKYCVKDIITKEGYNKIFCWVFDNENNVLQKKNIFFKFSPLLDPVKYMIGKYENCKDVLITLPKFENNTCHEKIRDLNNAAYVDGLFSYLTSQLLYTHRFLHGLDFYGSFLGIKNNFRYNVADDLEYLSNSTFFNDNYNQLFHIDNNYHNEIMNISTRNFKKRLHISSTKQTISPININNQTFNGLFVESVENTNKPIEDLTNNLIFTHNFHNSSSSANSSSSSSSSSSCSSRTSHTSNENDSNDDESDSSSSSESTSSESDDIDAIINKFPVQVICLEACKDTLDKLMIEDELTNADWGSILMQVIMTLCAYQKIFNFTHNDLHTNNIMFIETEKKHIIYHFNGKYYKVPTFGRLFKIIDFGRAIYKFKGNLICSDSFHPGGDAATQYNFGPYFNEDKPRLEPNNSFDLCRLACSLFDYFIEELDDIKKIIETDLIAKLIVEWCKDDKGRNVLYKNNGDERYPDFKLYKMIARTVHNHTPIAQLERNIFQNYCVSKKKIGKKVRIIDIDNIPTYV